MEKQKDCPSEARELTALDYVERAAFMARRMEEAEAMGPGDLENARLRLGNRWGLPSRLFYSLRYRKPKTIAADMFARLHNAYQAECDRQARRWQHERAIAAAMGKDDAVTKALIGAADYVAGDAMDGAAQAAERTEAE